jgi:hypothetical protein
MQTGEYRMKTTLVLCVFCLAICGTQAKSQRTYTIPTRFATAKVFIALPEDDRVTYTTGLMDGFYAAEMFRADGSVVERLAVCTKPMDSKQITAIITKYIQDHPESWHLPASVEAYNALNGACPGLMGGTKK